MAHSGKKPPLRGAPKQAHEAERGARIPPGVIERHFVYTALPKEPGRKNDKMHQAGRSRLRPKSPDPVFSPSGENAVHRTDAQSVIVGETVTIIAACISSRELVEIAAALTLIATENVDTPIGELPPVTKHRIVRSIADEKWRNRISSVLRDPSVITLSQLFVTRCREFVPSNAPNPLMDETWLNRVQAVFFQDEALQLIAKAILSEIPMPKAISEPLPEVEMPTPAPVVEQEPVAVTPHAESTVALQSGMVELVAQLELLQKAQRVADAFVRHYNEQQARMAVERPPATIPIAAPHVPRPVAHPIAERRASARRKPHRMRARGRQSIRSSAIRKAIAALPGRRGRGSESAVMAELIRRLSGLARQGQSSCTHFASRSMTHVSTLSRRAMTGARRDATIVVLDKPRTSPRDVGISGPS